MTKNALVKSLSGWAGKALAIGGEHCFELRPRFRIPGAGIVDLLSLRHTRDLFVVGLDCSRSKKNWQDRSPDDTARSLRLRPFCRQRRWKRKGQGTRQ